MIDHSDLRHVISEGSKYAYSVDTKITPVNEQHER